jgi:glycosyltransferase involved in cell wall biosynthesis
MNIGIDARFYGPLGKGLGRYTTELIRSLEVLDTENDYVVFLRRENFDQYEPKNPRFRKVLADFRWYSFEEQFLFPRTLLRERCDLVHFPHFNVPIFYRRPFVVTVHDLILLRFPTLRATTLSPFFYKLKFLAYRFVIRNALSRSKRVITVSEYTKRDILNRYVLPADKISVTYEATHPFCFLLPRSRRAELFQRLGLTISESTRASRGILRPYALYVGNAYPHKNLEALLLAFMNFPDREARIVLVGRDDYFYRRLAKFARSKGLSSVIFAGIVSDEELDALYRYARLSVFPSLYEGFGLPPLEAMTKGSPVLAASSAAFPEVLGDAALFFDPARPGALRNALLSLWNDESLREHFRHKGYERASTFSWEVMGQKTLDVYREAGMKS